MIHRKIRGKKENISMISEYLLIMRTSQAWNSHIIRETRCSDYYRGLSAELGRPTVDIGPGVLLW